MVLRHLQPSFTGGEISPSLYFRTDAADYSTWLKSALNVWVHPQGGVSNRPGTLYMGQAGGQQPCRLFSFPVSDQEGYIIEAGEKYLRFYTPDGAVLSNGEPLEITTPYLQQDISQLQTAQYNQTLYFAHPNYPLCRLVRTAVGAFAWEEVPLSYGPFMPANTDPAKQMRLYEQTETVESQGVAASLSFAPVNYPNLMVWAYFNDEWFYASETFGLNLSAIATSFNQTYGARGLSASVQGSILTLTSAAADGGDWNGKTFVLEYRNSFQGPALETATQTLSGGENAGTQTVVQPGRYILESSANYFTPLHVGALFCLVHRVEGQYQSGTLGYESTSQTILSGSDWSLRTSGTWTGTLQVQASSDLGLTWKTIRVLSRASGEDNLYISGDLNDSENLYQIRVCSGQITGQAGYELSAQGFIQRGVVKVISYTSPTQMVVTAQRAFGSQAWTSDWAEGSFSPARGYPRCVFVYQNRLGLAATHSEAQSLWFSKTGQWEDFGTARDSALSTDAISICLGGTQLSAITAVLVSNRLLIFTTGGEWTLTSSGALNVDTLQLEQHSRHGSALIAPLLVGNRALFVQANAQNLRDFVYDYATSSYTGEDLTLRAKHVVSGGTFVQVALSQLPDPMLWCVRSDGTALCLTYLPEQGICAWTRQTTNGQFLSVCTLLHRGQEEVWFAVRRAGGIFIEKLAPRLPDGDLIRAVFLDSALSQRFTQAQTQLSGLAHLEGQTVTVLADGNVVNGLSVQNGQVTLPHAASVVQAGLGYVSQLVTLPFASCVRNGQKSRPLSVRIAWQDSRGGKIGTQPSDLVPLVQRQSEPYNQPIALQNGEVTVLLRAEYQYKPSVMIEQEEPLPLTVLALWIQAA